MQHVTGALEGEAFGKCKSDLLTDPSSRIPSVSCMETYGVIRITKIQTPNPIVTSIVSSDGWGSIISDHVEKHNE